MGRLEDGSITFYQQGNFVDLDFDLSGGEAEIKPFEEFVDFSAITFPYAKYRTSIKDAIWDLNEKTINMLGDSSSTFTATNFGSEDYNQENLHFNATDAHYDLSKIEMELDDESILKKS